MKLVALFFTFSLISAPAGLEVGFAKADITPKVADGAKKVWIAGYSPGRSATGVHDPLYARTFVLHDTEADQKIALISVDLVGLQRPELLKVRAQLPGYAHVLISSTHNHEGPDVIGMWGPTPLRSGVDPPYLKLVIERCVTSVKDAEKALQPAAASYGVAEDETLIGDSRLPKVIDGKMRVLRFSDPNDAKKSLGLMVVWSCHPEAMGSKNREITADFHEATIAKLEKQHACPVAQFIGAVGGLMAPPRDRIKGEDGEDGEFLERNNWDYTTRYGHAVADLATKALTKAEPMQLTPFLISAAPVQLPVENKLYRAGMSAGVLNRDSFVYEGPNKRGEPLHKLKHALRTMAVETEVGYLQLGPLGIAAIPGELYPELLHGAFQDPADPNADFPDAELEPTVASMMPTKDWLVLGCAYDEIGYIIPKRQWDNKPPFAYGREKSQYGEMNSCGPQSAAILMQALTERIAAIK